MPLSNYTKPGNFVFSAIATVVTVAEILKNNGLAVEKSECTSNKVIMSKKLILVLA